MSAASATVMTAWSESLALFGSTCSSEPIVAVLARVPVALTRAVMCSVAEAPFASEPTAQMPVPWT